MWSNVISPTSGTLGHHHNPSSSASLFTTTTSTTPPGGEGGESDAGACSSSSSSCSSSSPPPPPTRYKHSTTIHHSRSDSNYFVYVYGGRSGTFALKDFWELDLNTGVWREIKPPSAMPDHQQQPSCYQTTSSSSNNNSGDSWPPRLQEHTLVSARNRLYVFGGECHHNSDTSSHVWVWQREEQEKGWLKITFKQQESCAGNTTTNKGARRNASSTTTTSNNHQCAPVMRRGHSAVVAEVDGATSMVVYGGYRDLKGSLADCWAYAVGSNTWTQLSSPQQQCQQNQNQANQSGSKQSTFWTSILSYWTNNSTSSHQSSTSSSSSSSSSSSRRHRNNHQQQQSTSSYTNLAHSNNGFYYNNSKSGKQEYYDGSSNNGGGSGGRPVPPARHNHSAVQYNGKMYVYGGMCDLVELADFWAFDFDSRRWTQIKCLHNPGCLKGHAATVVGAYMYLFGGETKAGVRVDDVWKFDFCAETFEKLQFPGCHPCPRVFATATKLPVRTNKSHKRCSDDKPNSARTHVHRSNNHATEHQYHDPGAPALVARQQDHEYHPSTTQEENLQLPPQPLLPFPRPTTFRKSTSVVRFADTQHLVTYSDEFGSSPSPAASSVHTPPSCSDYSSMETINYVENPNYRRFVSGGGAYEDGGGPGLLDGEQESFEMKAMVVGAGSVNTPSTNNGGDDRSTGTSSRTYTVRNQQHVEYVLVIGGLESHKSAVFSKRDLVVWRLRVDCCCTAPLYADEDEEYDDHDDEYGRMVLQSYKHHDISDKSGHATQNPGSAGSSNGSTANPAIIRRGSGEGATGPFSRERSFEVEF